MTGQHAGVAATWFRDDGGIDTGAAWQALVDLYTRPGAAGHCLELQAGDGTSVTALLTLMTAAAAGNGAVTRQAAADVAGLSEAFQSDVLRPLRSARDGLKRWQRVLPDAMDVRESVLERELAAEQLEQRLVLECLADGRGPPDDPCGDACLSVARYLRLRRLSDDTDTLQTLGYLLSIALGEYDSLHIQRVLERALVAEVGQRD
ncbi:MAG: TIGR02444 family protein [Candidatus Brocadiia bacterium]